MCLTASLLLLSSLIPAVLGQGSSLVVIKPINEGTSRARLPFFG